MFERSADSDENEKVPTSFSLCSPSKPLLQTMSNVQYRTLKHTLQRCSKYMTPLCCTSKPQQGLGQPLCGTLEDAFTLSHTNMVDIDMTFCSLTKPSCFDIRCIFRAKGKRKGNLGRQGEDELEGCQRPSPYDICPSHTWRQRARTIDMARDRLIHSDGARMRRYMKTFAMTDFYPRRSPVGMVTGLRASSHGSLPSSASLRY